MKKFFALMPLIVVLLSAGKSHAQIEYLITNSSGVFQSSYNLNQGATVTLQVYLRETTAGTLSANGGLGSAAVRLTYNSTAGVASIASEASDITAAIPPWDFSTTTGTVANASGVLNLLSPAASGVSPPPGATDRILLGTFKLTASSIGTTNLVASDPNSVAGDTTYFNTGASMDNLISNSQNVVFNVVVVPEPMSIMLFSGLIGAGFYWKKKNTHA